MCLARYRLHRKEGRRIEERDSSSFPELDILERMNNQMRISWFVVRGAKKYRCAVAHKKYFEVDFP